VMGEESRQKPDKARAFGQKKSDADQKIGL
jgi:hypothetical protein